MRSEIFEEKGDIFSIAAALILAQPSSYSAMLAPPLYATRRLGS